MGGRGPVPKRSDQRRRTNAPDQPIDSLPGAAHAPSPEADENWHPVAKAWFDALGTSGQSQLYQPSDWATAVLIAESMSRDLSPQAIGITEQGEVVRDVIPLKGASLSAYLRAMAVLMVTEGDRRRLHLELERTKASDPDEDRSQATITSLQSRLSG